jgi:hypothetical protein
VIWELSVEPLQDGLVALNKLDGVLRVSLAGDHIRIITKGRLTKADLKTWLLPARVHVTSILRGEPTLEDVFLSLAK